MDVTGVIDLLTQQGLPTFIILAILWFVAFRVWPWLTEYLDAGRENALLVAASLENMAKHLDNTHIALERFAQRLAELFLEK